MSDEQRKGQEGSRWINEQPSGVELSDWFSANVKLHDDGLSHADYVQGVTLIPATEKVRQVVGYDSENNPVIKSIEHLAYVPYAKVETRVKYFNDLMALKEDKWYGAIEPVVNEKQDPSLPPGFFYLPVPTGDGVGVRFVCCTMKVTVFDRESYKEEHRLVDSRRGIYKTFREGKKLIDAPPATKMIPMLRSDWHPTERGKRVIAADPSSLMKAETGAIGRALGMAGMLVIPGTGIATAEDMAEVGSTPEAAATSEPSSADNGQLPSEDQPSGGADELTTLRAEAADAISKLSAEHPDAFKLFQTWAQERGVGRLDECDNAATLRGLTAKARADFEESEGK